MNDMTPRLTFIDLRGASPAPMEPPTRPVVLGLGNFDGVHLAHAALLSRTRDMAADLSTDRSADRSAATGGAPLCGVFSFLRPSIDYTNRAAVPGHLTTLREKLRLFARAGMDLACLCDFPAVRHLSPDEFIHLLTDRAHCCGVVCGYDFRFGAGGVGQSETLAAWFDRSDGRRRAAILPVMLHDGQPISSTRIRARLIKGEPEAACEMLGRPYALEATVVHGKHLGRVWGFPTANQYFPKESLVPAHGVYATLCHTPFGVFPGVSNVGCHPTVDVHARVNCETYIVGFSNDLYGTRIRVEFLKYLRPEMAFPDVGALIDAIRQDAAYAEAYVNDHLSFMAAMNGGHQ